jgi:hypothetical protein
LGTRRKSISGDVGYQVVVERVKPKPLRVFSVNLPSTVTQVTVSPEFIETNAEYTFEVLAIEASGNQTNLGGRVQDAVALGFDQRGSCPAWPIFLGKRGKPGWLPGSAVPVG